MKICQWCKEKETKRKFCSRECFGEFRADRRKRYYKENKERELETRKKYVEENREKVLNYNKEWRENNLEHVKEYAKEYNSKTKDKKAEYWNEYYSNNKEQISTRKKEYYKNLSPEMKEKRRLRKNEWCKTAKSIKEFKKTPKFKIRNMLSKTFIRMKVKKPCRTEHILGCSYDEAIKYFENLFEEGMTWGNHGKVWHFDHIKPMATVDDYDLEGVLQLNKIENIRPLWANENHSKGAKFEGNDYRYYKPYRSPLICDDD
jgi:hypothetical protein